MKLLPRAALIGMLAVSLSLPLLGSTEAIASPAANDNSNAAYNQIVANKEISQEAKEKIRLLTTEDLDDQSSPGAVNEQNESIHSDGTIQISSTESGESLKMSLKGTSTAEVFSSHASVKSSEQNIQATERLTDYGLGQIVATIDNPSRNFIDYSISIPQGHSLRMSNDGGIDVVDDTTHQEDGHFITPWAIDATGAMLETSYQIVSNTEIRQTVNLAQAEFPVTADPSAIWWAKTTATCAVDLGVFLVPAVKVASRAPKVIKIIEAARKTTKGAEAVKKLGGTAEAAKFVIKYGVNELRANLPASVRKLIPSSSIPADKAAAVAGLYGLIRSQFWDALGVGSCISLYRAL